MSDKPCHATDSTGQHVCDKAFGHHSAHADGYGSKRYTWLVAPISGYTTWNDINYTMSDGSPEELAVVRQFDTGANRDTEDGKLDVEGFLSPQVLFEYARYMHSHRLLKDGTMRASDNWQKGIPQDVYVKSLLRHVLDLWLHHRGVPQERPEGGGVPSLHETLGGIVFNICGYWHEELQP